jgi:hypothetical protein
LFSIKIRNDGKKGLDQTTTCFWCAYWINDCKQVQNRTVYLIWNSGQGLPCPRYRLPTNITQISHHQNQPQQQGFAFRNKVSQRTRKNNRWGYLQHYHSQNSSPWVATDREQGAREVYLLYNGEVRPELANLPSWC